jgi:hypothetical protein
MVSDEHLNTQVHQSKESIEALRAEWDTLLAGFRTLPRSLLWNGCCPGGVPCGKDQLRVLAFRDAESSLVGVASTFHTLGGELRLLRLLGDGSHDSNNLDLPVRAGYEQRHPVAPS